MSNIQGTEFLDVVPTIRFLTITFIYMTRFRTVLSRYSLRRICTIWNCYETSTLSSLSLHVVEADGNLSCLELYSDEITSINTLKYLHAHEYGSFEGK